MFIQLYIGLFYYLNISLNIFLLLFSEVFPDIRINVKGKSTETRVPFPFEVEMWSFGVTIYQCSTG